MPAGASVCRRSRGQASVEVALVMMALLFLLSGAVDFAGACNSTMRLGNAAFNGARYGSFQPNDTTGIVVRVQKESAGIAAPNAVRPANVVGLDLRP
jgi:Flp pilus assembly protein TadG